MTESSRPPAASLSSAVAIVGDALAVAPAGILTDFDGTLSPMVADPASARLGDGGAELLSAVARRLAVVAVITGRSALDARRLLGVPEILVVGNHGVEWLEPGGVAPRSQQEGPIGMADAVAAALPALEGVLVEDKGLSITVHYRNAPDPSTAREPILAAVRAVAPTGYTVSEGRMSVELRSRTAGDKGTAATSIVERYGLRGVVVFGDDVTDLDMFRAVARLRAERGLRAAIVAVGGHDREVPTEVTAAADVVLGEPEDVLEVFRAL